MRSSVKISGRIRHRAGGGLGVALASRLGVWSVDVPVSVLSLVLSRCHLLGNGGENASQVITVPALARGEGGGAFASRLGFLSDDVPVSVLCLSFRLVVAFVRL